MSNSFKAISISYKTAPLEIREAVSLHDDNISKLLERLKNFIPASDLLVVSTCNRTEVYYSSENDYSKEIIKLIGIEKGLYNLSAIESYFDIINDPLAAIRHLFNVSLGLESQVVGDLQISNQVKKSYQYAADANTAGPFLHRLMHTIFAASKRVQQETSFRDGAASVSYATVELAKEVASEINNPQILLVGLGEIGTDVYKNLVKAKFGTITLANRTIEKAHVLSDEENIQVVEWENIPEQITKSDVVISAVPGIQAFFTKKSLEKSPSFSHKYFIDLSVPRSIETSVEEIPSILLFNVDDIKNKASQALEKRKEAIPQVESIVTEMMEEFNAWSKETEFSSVIREFKDALDKIRQQEINRHIKSLTEEEGQKVEIITKGIVQKILKLPVLQLKAACQRGEAEQLSEVLRALFDLEGNKKE
ncbi:MAG TPA: glutamyl-tRNA reductase [Cytophagales bacterium]|nr:glutamyl-tRNA reductase [Cytophagales bacterium]